MGFILFLFIKNQNENIKTVRIVIYPVSGKTNRQETNPKPPQKPIQPIYPDNGQTSTSRWLEKSTKPALTDDPSI